MSALLPIVFDALYWVAWVLVYGSAAAAGLFAGGLVWGPALWQRALGVALGYFVFLHAFVIAVGGLRWLVQSRLTEGRCRVGANRMFIAWGLNSVFQGLFTTSFFAYQVHLLFYLRYLYYRSMGMKLSLGVIIGTRVSIRQAELIELGPHSVVGEHAMLSCHVNTNGKVHIQGRIRIGERAMVGAFSVVGPGFDLGEGSVLGARAVVPGDTKIGAHVRIGPGVIILPGARIGDRARIAAGSVLATRTVVPPGETWGGNPAVRIAGKRDDDAAAET